MHTQETTTPVHTDQQAESIARIWQLALTPWWQATVAILPTYLVTRVILLLLTYLGGVLFTLPNNSTFSLNTNAVLYSWYHWDVPRYLSIATQGYIEQSTTAYFPLYPAVVHALNAILHRDILLTGMLVSNLAFFAALIVLYRFVNDEFDRATALRSVLYISIFPTALIFFAAYAEALYLLFLLLCLYALRHKRWWMAGLFGGLAALTHISGFLLFIVFLYQLFYQFFIQKDQESPKRGISNFIPFIASLFVPLGTAIYMYGLSKQFGDALAFLHPLGSAHPSAHWPWIAPLTALHDLLHNSLYSFIGTHSLLELLLLTFFLICIVLCFIGPERLEREKWVLPFFIILMLGYALTFPAFPLAIPNPSDPLPALFSITPLLVPGFLILARLGRHTWVHQAYLLLSLPLFTFLVLQLLTGHWMI